MKYRTSVLTVNLKSPSHIVFEVMCNNEDFSWRSDLKRIDILNEKEFIEIYPNDNQTTFKITKIEPDTYYSFDLKNKIFEGYWTGELSPTSTNGTKLTLTEHIHVYNPIIRIFASMFMNLKKMQETYVHDLKVKLQEID